MPEPRYPCRSLLVGVPRYIRVCSLIEADVTVANLDEGKSSDLGAFGAPPFIA
jgi:hypothetical protein